MVYYIYIFQPHLDIFSPNNMNIVHMYFNSQVPMPLLVEHFQPNYVKFSIQKYSLIKSPGFDLFTAEVARCLPKRTIILNTHIFNASLRLSRLLFLWKFTKMILIPKPNKSFYSLTSYRPISLLTFLSKILERLLLKRILSITHDNKILPLYQFSFRAKYSTTHQAHKVVDVVSIAFKKKLFCICSFFDVLQEVHRVCHNGSLYKFLPLNYYLLIN